MTIGTPVLYNAALSGFIGGMQSGRKGAQTAPASYSAITQAGVTFATAFDAALTASTQAAITTLLPKLASAGATVPNTTATQTNSQASAPAALSDLVQGYFSGSQLQGNANDTTASTYTQAVNDILAAFTEYQASASIV
jgi:hypothetical protein